MDKKNFFVYTDKGEQVQVLTDEQAGQLFKALFSYAIKGVDYQGGDIMVKLVFIPMRNDINRDALQYEKRCNANKSNGFKGGRPRKNDGLSEKPTKTDGLNIKPKKPDNDNDNNNEERKVKKEILSFAERHQNFHDSLIPFTEQYDKTMIRAFFDYWSEPNLNQTKMRFEMQKTWSLQGRLRTWNRRNDNGK